MGLFCLSQSKNLNLNCGFYRDDGLGVTIQRPQQVENTKKRICEIFRQNGLKLTIEANKKIVNFLDVTLDLTRNSFSPYLKPNNTLLYVNCQSNHPPSILKNIPISVNKRLCELSSSEEIFRKSVRPYQEALEKSGYTHKLVYSLPSQNQTQHRRQRKRKIVWYNPPFSKNVETNLGKEFFKLLDQHFPKCHILHPIINRNGVKLSYSCLSNVRNIISKHNGKVIRGDSNNPPPCNCDPEMCPVDGKCQATGVIYQATVKHQIDKVDKYIGLTARKFIERHTEHMRNFENRNPKNSTSLSRKIWDLQRRNIQYELKWVILQNAKPYQPGSRQCQLCLTEIFYILFKPEETTLNSREEVMNKCRHSNKFKLSKI